MSSLCIEINKCSAVLLRGGNACEAHAGNSTSISKWIDEVFAKVGKVYVTGWNNLMALRQSEVQAAEEQGDSPVNSR